MNQKLTTEQRHHHEAELAEHEATIAELDAIAACAKNFQPGTPPPAALNAQGSATFARHWRGKKARLEDLLFLASDFRDFWRKHQAAYDPEGHAELTQHTKEEHDRKEAAGELGAAETIRQRWIHFTEGFIEWTEKKPVTTALIEAYPKQQNVPLMKGREFLKTLLTAKGNYGLHSELEITLERVGIKVPQKVAAECYLILCERRPPASRR